LDAKAPTKKKICGIQRTESQNKSGRIFQEGLWLKKEYFHNDDDDDNDKIVKIWHQAPPLKLTMEVEGIKIIK
jgi:hypothetical protein